MEPAGGEAGGYFEVFLKYGQPPGWHYGQWDFRQAYQYYQTEQDKDQEVKFDAQTDGFQTGKVLSTHAWVSAAWRTAIPGRMTVRPCLLWAYRLVCLTVYADYPVALANSFVFLSIPPFVCMSVCVILQTQLKHNASVQTVDIKLFQAGC